MVLLIWAAFLRNCTVRSVAQRHPAHSPLTATRQAHCGQYWPAIPLRVRNTGP
jgi:hypothetical protein